VVDPQHHNLTTLLSVPWMALLYIVCNVQLGFHLWHGSFSLFKTLGMSGERQLGLARKVSWALSTAVAGGNVLIALAIVAGPAS
jgi:succinate dehydrogenase / fumarate reductase cytochrome b subunit